MTRQDKGASMRHRRSFGWSEDGKRFDQEHGCLLECESDLRVGPHFENTVLEAVSTKIPDPYHLR